MNPPTLPFPRTPTATIGADELFAVPPGANPDAVAAGPAIAADLAGNGRGAGPANEAGPTGPTDAEPAPAGVTAPGEPAGGPGGTGPDDGAEPVETDSAGVEFDPTRHLHAMHPRGGRWIPKRQPATATAPDDDGAAGASVVGADDGDAAPVEPAGVATGAATGAPDVFTAMAAIHCRGFYGLAAPLLSDEWLATAAEHKQNVEILADYYRFKNIQPSSPGWALLAHIAGYAGKRIVQPKTQSRLAAIGSFLRGRWFAFVGWRRASKLSQL